MPLEALNKLYELQDEPTGRNICSRERRPPRTYIAAYAALPGAMLFPYSIGPNQYRNRPELLVHYIPLPLKHIRRAFR